MFEQTVDGTGRGSRSPTGCRCSILLCWLVRQPCTNSWTRVWVQRVKIALEAVDSVLGAFMAIIIAYKSCWSGGDLGDREGNLY